MRVLTDPASTPAAPGAEALERRGLGRRATWAALPLALGLLCATPWCGARPLPASERQVERTAPAVARTGRFAIAPRFEGAESFAEGLAAVRLGGKWGFVDKHGRMVIPPRFNPDQPEYRAGFSGGLAPVNFTAGGMGAKWGFIDATGAMAIEPRLAGTASGVAVCLQNFLGAATTQIYGLIADGTMSPIAYVACSSAFMTMVCGATPFLMKRRAA